MSIVNDQQKVALLACQKVRLFLSQTVGVEVQKAYARRARFLLEFAGKLQEQTAFALPSGRAQNERLACALTRKALELRRCVASRHK